MLKLATNLNFRRSICGQILYQSNTAQDVCALNIASFSTVAKKAFAGGSSAVAQKTYAGGYGGSSTVGQKTYAGDNGGSSTLGQKTYTGGNASFSNAGPKAFTGERVYAAYNVYKGKAALSAEPVAPTFSKREAGGVFIKRSGYIMISISPSMGERKYDWEKKQRFALSPVEVGSIISMGPTGTCEFFHDPGMQTSNAGQVRKTLVVNANQDGKGYFISLTVVDTVKNINARFAVPLTLAEFAVMRTSFSFALPHIMGWDRYTSQSPAFKREDAANIVEQRQHFDSEWDR